MGSVAVDTKSFSEDDIYLFKEGNHFHLYNIFGAHPTLVNAEEGVAFAVWAPNAKSVSVFGDFNSWNKESHPLNVRWDSSGIWEGFVPGAKNGDKYKYHIVSNDNNQSLEKIDPYAFFSEVSPKTASIVWDIDHQWNDQAWMQNRSKYNGLSAPISVYEVHLGSWKHQNGKSHQSLSYRELAVELVQYVKDMGFTHVQFLPVMVHPFYGSWGYQTLGYFAPSNRYGTPQDFMHLIDQFHQNNIGVLLDWVPSHFPSDAHGLADFDGSTLYEHQDLSQKVHPDWNSYIFNLGRNEVKEFLISSALFWMDKYHIDGLRVDAVASMLYLDYSREEGDWSPNIHGGNENLESIKFIKQLNEVVYQNYPNVQMIAEESTAWTNVSRPTSCGGLGFGMKWNMGWMHDTLEYFSKDPVYRKHHHNDLTFSLLYAFTENFVLSLSHDEVVHGKGSMISKMPCDDWQKFANLKLLYGFMFGHPGKKLLFMGNEFAQRKEWNHDHSLEWHLLEHSCHQSIQQWVKDLNKVYKVEPALFEKDFDSEGFEWIDGSNCDQGILSFVRKSDQCKDQILVVCNFTPVTYFDYLIGVPCQGYWKEILNSDAECYGGSGHGNLGGLQSNQKSSHGRETSLTLTVPPLGVNFFKLQL